MAQNEVQKYYTDQNFYDAIRQPLNTFYENLDRMEKLSNFLNSASAADYPTIPAGTLTDVAGLRTQINTFLAATETLAMVAEVKSFIRV